MEINNTSHEHSGSRRRILAGGAIVLVLIVGVIAFLAIARHRATTTAAQNRTRSEEQGRVVETTQVKQSPPERTILLTGEVRAYYSVTLFPRVSGFLDVLKVDIGDTVKKGQLLAHIESPEQEQAFNSAQADAFNKKRIAVRMRLLRKRNLISQQQADQAISDAEVAEATLRTQGVLRGYEEVVAPFDGTISNRYVDPGTLLQNSSTSQAASQPLFLLTKSDQLRVFIYIDQKDAPFVRVSDAVEISLPNRNEERFHSNISMIAAELDPRTRTLLAEFIMDNSSRKIVAGSFVQVRLTSKTPQLMELPVQALVMRGNKPFVPLIGTGDKLQYARIDLAENTGESLLIRSGVNVGDRVALDVGNTIVEGQKVRPVASPKGAAGTVGKPGGSS